MIKNSVRKLLARLERFALPPTDNPNYPPLFIVGPPRSGTTLVYLLLTQHFHVSYISNFLAMTPESPVLLGRLAKIFRPLRGPADLKNRYGETEGWRGPNQGYRIWNVWLPTETDYISPTAITSEVRTGLRRTIAGIERINNAPFINKWQRHSVRIDALSSIFPEALFLRVIRDHREVAQSLLKGRRAITGSVDQWFSARPADMPDTGNLSPVEQVCYQAVLIDRQIARDLAKLRPDKHLTIGYEDICATPEIMLQKVADWYGACSGHVLAAKDMALPPLFANKGGKVSKALEAEIEKICAKI